MAATDDDTTDMTLERRLGLQLPAYPAGPELGGESAVAFIETTARGRVSV
ncbi:MAG: hypothetical protein ACR2QK_22690 [Acidimicrobiales bacterium]